MAQPSLEHKADFCPYCDQEIPHSKLLEVEQRYSKDIEARVAQEVKEELDASNQKIVDLQQALEAKDKESADAVEDARKAGEQEGAKQAKRQAESEFAEREATLRDGNEDLAQREAEFKRQQDSKKASHEKELSDQRVALEKDAADQVAAVRTESAAEAKQLKKELTRLQKKVDQHNQVEGEDFPVLTALLEMFPEDNIEARGADGEYIVHELMDGETCCGTYLYDVSKVSKPFQKPYAKKLLETQRGMSAVLSIMPTCYPSKDMGQVATVNGVVVAHPYLFTTLVSLQRKVTIDSVRRELGAKDHAQKTEAVMDFLRSPKYQNVLDQVREGIAELEQVEIDLMKSEQTFRNRRQAPVEKIQQAVLGILENEVDSILKGDSSGED